MIQSLRGFPQGRLVKGGAKQRDLREVVEMARLQRSVLTVIGETQQFARFIGRSAGALQFDEGADGEDRRGRAPAIDPQRAEFGLLRPLRPRISDPAIGVQAEQEVLRDEGGADAFAFRREPPRRIDENRLGNVLSRIGPNALSASGRRLLHEGRQPRQLLPAGAGPGRLFRDVKPGVHRIVGRVPAVLTRFEASLLPVAAKRDPVILDAAMAAKDQRKEQLVRLARLRAEFRDLYMPNRLRFQGGPHRVAAREKLMQAKREYREAAFFVGAEPGPLEQILLQNGRAGLSIRRNQLREFLGRTRRPSQGPRRLPHEPLRFLLGTNSERGLDPRRERTPPKIFIVVRRLPTP